MYVVLVVLVGGTMISTMILYFAVSCFGMGDSIYV